MMNLFDQLVLEAMKSRSELSPLRTVVEKELLHHDILREMAYAGFLDKLTFIGGTCLRSCYGSPRLSEDLDFTGGSNFQPTDLKGFATCIVARLEAKYGLTVTVDAPRKEFNDVATWKIKIITRPEQKMLPIQRINIDICIIPSHDRAPMMLRQIYGVDMGTSGLIIQAQSREEIFADKMIAFALRENRLKNRDLWDMIWLKQQSIQFPPDLLIRKLNDRNVSAPAYLETLGQRQASLTRDPKTQHDFINEMKRFLPPQTITETLSKNDFWGFLCNQINDECKRVISHIGP